MVIVEFENQRGLSFNMSGVERTVFNARQLLEEGFRVNPMLVIAAWGEEAEKEYSQLLKEITTRNNQ